MPTVPHIKRHQSISLRHKRSAILSHIFRPAGSWHGTKKCPFVDQVEGARSEIVCKEISQNNPSAKTPKTLFAWSTAAGEKSIAVTSYPAVWNA